ncbi:AraC family transcriptional regulator [Salmonella enterica subsp. diarizonae]|nr:AraC family transcriptional regulator [Salmonella enterica subsp. diarizonae]
MEKLRKTFLSSNPGVEFIEYCTLPYINLPDSHLLSMDCYIDVFYILNGNAELMFNTPPSRMLSSGDFIFLNRKCTDCFIFSGGEEAVVIHARIIPHGIYKELMIYHGYYNSLCVLNGKHSGVLSIASEMIKFLIDLKKTESGENLFLESPIALFFVHLYLNEIADSSLLVNDPGNIFSRLMLEMLKNPGYPWNIKKIAQKYCISTNYFISEFRKISGFTPFNFLKRNRLIKGRQLLENTSFPVSVIARQCGYNSQASFSFYIKKEFGLPPLRIRRNAKIKNDTISLENSC